MSNILVIAAHSDDELLGSGCYIDKMIEEGNTVDICCMTSYSAVREENITEKMKILHDEIGIRNTWIAPYGASEFDNIQHITKVQFIEDAIVKSKCDTVVTHSINDLHKDHVEVSQITLEAVRFYQRSPDVYKNNPIKKVMMMEIPCASLWGLDRFNPNCFVHIDEESIERKIKRVSVYDNVIRNDPHPRSSEVIKALAKVRGSQCGSSYAEAFRVVFEVC